MLKKILNKFLFTTQKSLKEPKENGETTNRSSTYSFANKLNTEEYDEKVYEGIPRKIIFIASTPRVGSTLLSRALTDIKLSPVSTEFFNDVHRSDYKERWGDLSDSEYIRQLFRYRTNSKGIFAIKAHHFQFEKFESMMKNYTCDYIFIERKNKFLQAISFFRGSKTGAWASFEKHLDILSDDSYDYFAIHHCLVDILNQNKKWMNFFQKNNIKPIHIIYEDFEENYDDTLISLVKTLDEEKLDRSSIPAPKMEKQRDNLTDKFYNQFILDTNKENPDFIKYKNFISLKITDYSK